MAVIARTGLEGLRFLADRNRAGGVGSHPREWA